MQTPTVYDEDLRGLFSDDPKHRRQESAVAFLRRHRSEIRRLVANWTGQYEYCLDLVFKEMIARARHLKLKAVGSERALAVDFAILLTVRVIAERLLGASLDRGMTSRRILALMHADLVPPDDLSGVPEERLRQFKTELDVVTTLRESGHELMTLGVDEELKPIRDAVRSFKPYVAFNLLESFRYLRELDHNVVSYLELLGCRYTGCNPRGLVIARDKALSKKILAYHRIKAPRFAVFPKNRKRRAPRKLEYPMIVKSLNSESSTGISQASLVRTEEKMLDRVEFIHDSVGTDAIVEEYIEGREIYAAVLGNQRVQVMPTWELTFENKPEDAPLIMTEAAKFDVGYQERWGVVQGPANLGDALEERVRRVTRRIYRALCLSGYARIDFRLRGDDELFFLEANPNPEIAKSEEYASAAATVGYDYSSLLEKIVSLGRRWSPTDSTAVTAVP